MPSDHTRRVMAALEATADVLAPVRFPLQSWARCLNEHRLLPGDCTSFPVVGQREVKLAREAMGERLSLACSEVELLSSVIGPIGYSVAMADAGCLMVLCQTDTCSDRRPPMEQLGAIWTENETGTNGVGTCLQQLEPTSVFLDEHFFNNFTSFSCAGTPLFAPDCSVWGALDISIFDPGLHPRTHALAFEVLRASAERLAETLFRHELRDCAILKLQGREGRPYLLAVNDDFTIVGADRTARRALAFPMDRFAPVSLWEIYENNPDGVRPRDGATLPIELVGRADGILVRGTASQAPEGRRGARRGRIERVPRSEPEPEIGMDEWAGSDGRMVDSVRILRRLMHTGFPVLVMGETGVGKDALARAYHAESPLRGKPYVALNCAAVPESLIESELFGYGGGAFTDAGKHGAPGIFAQADGGTLFLDEISDMPMALQTRLLRVLDSPEVSPVGSGKLRHVNVQVIAATNRRLEQRVSSGEFREDLFHRLAGVVVDVPALRERTDRIAVIDRVVCQATRKRSVGITPAVRDRLLAHDWPGNFRELALVVERAVALATGGVVDVGDLLLRPIPTTPHAALPASPPGATRPVDPGRLDVKAWTGAAERAAILDALNRWPGDVLKAAAELGMSRATLYRRLKAHQIEAHVIRAGRPERGRSTRAATPPAS